MPKFDYTYIVLNRPESAVNGSLERMHGVLRFLLALAAPMAADQDVVTIWILIILKAVIKCVH